VAAATRSSHTAVIESITVIERFTNRSFTAVLTAAGSMVCAGFWHEKRQAENIKQTIRKKMFLDFIDFIYRI